MLKLKYKYRKKYKYMNLSKDKIKHFLNNPNLIILEDEELQRQILEAALDEDISILECVWKRIPEELQTEYLVTITTLQQYDDPFFMSSLWCATRRQVQEANPELFLEIISQISEDNDYLETVMENTSESLLESVIFSLLQMQNLQNLPLSPSLAKKIIDITNCEIPIVLTIQDAAELSISQLEYLETALKISSVKIENSIYDLNIYKICRAKISEILEGIDLQANQGNPNREKYIFGEVINRLANYLCYNYELAEKEKKGEANNTEVENARNLIGGLINKSCVCVGIAETVRNVLACIGIECINIGGNKDVHMWNQVKLDGEWFNMDLTWDLKRIINLEPPQHLLKSDNDFRGHTAAFYETKECNRTIPISELIQYIFNRQFQISPEHIANLGKNFCVQQPGNLQQGVLKVQNALSMYKREVPEK